MATIYNINIKTVSAFTAYTEKHVQELFEQFLKDYRDPVTKLGFESTEVVVNKVVHNPGNQKLIDLKNH